MGGTPWRPPRSHLLLLPWLQPCEYGARLPSAHVRAAHGPLAASQARCAGCGWVPPGGLPLRLRLRLRARRLAFCPDCYPLIAPPFDCLPLPPAVAPYYLRNTTWQIQVHKQELWGQGLLLKAQRGNE